jgi:hypothetical protein
VQRRYACLVGANERESPMADLAFVALVVLFFVALGVIVRGAERL